MFGELPATAPALVVSFAARWRWLELTLEGLATLSVSREATTGRVNASLLAMSVLPCAHVELFIGCLGVSLGALRGEGDGIDSPRHGTELYASAIARGGIELPVAKAVSIRMYGEAVAPLTRITLQLAAQEVWRMPSVAARLGATAGVQF